VPVVVDLTVADLGEGTGGSTPPRLFWVKQKEITEGRKAGRASKTTQLKVWIRHYLVIEIRKS